MFQTSLKGIRRDGHRCVDVIVLDEQDGSVETRPRGEPDSMDEDVGLFAWMFSGKGREKFLRRGVRSNIERIETSDGGKLIFEFEDAAHKSLLIPEIQGHTSSR
jgi:hypothetical protein